MRKSTHTFFQNNDDANLFLQAKLITENKILVIPGSGVNTEIFQKVRKENKGKIFLFVVRLETKDYVNILMPLKTLLQKIRISNSGLLVNSDTIIKQH